MAIEHMNSSHKDVLVAFCKKFAGVDNPTNVRLDDINEDGVSISCDENSTFIPFLKKAELNNNGFKNTIIELYESIKDENGVEKSLLDFINGFKTLIISSIKDGFANSSYAPFIRQDDNFYICISSVAAHYEAIRQNPDKISILFIQNENEAKSLFARVRASFNAVCEFVDDSLKDSYLDIFEANFKNESALKFIRDMKDFHIVKISPKNGRFVKGFGSAYDTNGLKIINANRVNNPHEKR
ncbi:HugZ family heme oxygenase [Campylobacter gastrosuis]|uniref:HugZ family heme oxygenase n=1 Tax=Campylobacter gastrosuis TaxID=2974576 RepID=A0ABT7HQQ7_9BACT|nr:HugZ family heme oxygenase [Campylobacter gastrosuis]MDL0088953.1 HugZ family heme oxygenase [Campylobacter gastrosuis]